MYKLIKSDGSVTERKTMTLKQMQKFVGGYIEHFGDVICNEDGRRFNLPINGHYPMFLGNIIIQE